MCCNLNVTIKLQGIRGDTPAEDGAATCRSEKRAGGRENTKAYIQARAHRGTMWWKDYWTSNDLSELFLVLSERDIKKLKTF